jgi:hypothetical protein
MNCKSTLWLLSLELLFDMAVSTAFVPPSPSLISTIFRWRLPGMEAAYCSAKFRAPAISVSGSRGYKRSMRPIMVSTSPVASMRRDNSSLAVLENAIR